MATQRARTLDERRLEPLARWLASAITADHIEIRSADLLSGGAVQENWKLAVDVRGGPRSGSHTWVVRTDAVARIPLSLDRASEFRVLETAFAAGVTVAEPIARCADDSIIGAPFLVQAFVPGTAQGRRIVRDPEIAVFGPDLAASLGATLAKVHLITPSTADLPMLALPMRPAARTEVQRLRDVLDNAGEARPALEYVLAWLDRYAPERRPLALVHGDYRTGNYLVHDKQIAAILDWEFAHWGDPHEDIGWFCARCWRFGAFDREAGGIAARAEFYRGYDSVATEPLDRTVVPYWEVYALAKWAVVAVLQGDRFRKGGEASLELALTGLMPPEMELDALDLIGRIESGEIVPWR